MGSKNYAYTGGWQQFKVPKRVKSLTVTLEGGGSGGVEAGRVSGKLAVSDRQTLFIMVGRRGRPNAGATGGTGTFGGGGAGGDGREGDGGYSGGGATAIRRGGTTGSILCVAGGAGGLSGDGGKGGQGGHQIGENGFPGGDGAGVVGNATGGTQIQGGNGGQSGSGSAYAGQNAVNTALAPAGAGGGPGLPSTVGGGGGGGGFHPGGGGQAGLIDVTPAGGGGGGSNHSGNLSGFSSTRGKGGTANGSVTISWVDPSPANQPPSPPTDVRVGGKVAADDMVTRSTGTLTITAKVDDPNTGQRVRLVAVYSAKADYSSGVKTVISLPVAQTKRATVRLSGLSKATLYHVRLYTRDSHGLQSANWRSLSLWTNRPPIEPTVTAPVDGVTVAQLSSVTFSWTHQDPDNSGQRAFNIRWRIASTPLTPAGQWTSTTFNTGFNTYVADPGVFKANQIYEWQVRTRDPQNDWGPFSLTSSFFVSGDALAPLPLDPSRDEAVDVTVPVELQWVFRDPDQGDGQSTADVRWRAIGSADWIVRLGDLVAPGDAQSWVLPGNTFAPRVRYEWQVRTTDTVSSALSDWSESETFWGITTPGALITDVVVTESALLRTALGVGHNRVYVYDRGGTRMRGEITPLSSLTWGRQRDDIFNATFATNGLGKDGGEFYSQIHTWMHEVVVFRDGERVFEGPITHIEDGVTSEGAPQVTFQAKDVMAYLYRRIMRQGYNDSYRVVNGVVLGDFSVVERAAKVIQNALAPDDPNLLPYLTTYNFADDAGQSRVVPDYTKTAWEEVDDMAANSGLDYAVFGRRILIWDTHRPIGRLPEMRSEHFSNPPIITEYGMQLATSYGVTNGSGLFGLAEESPAGYGLVELLASSYGETDAGATDVLTNASKTELEKVLTSQATRGIAGRYPAPMLVRVPDNSALNPDANLDINDLVPGVWVPLRAKGGVREISQWQKLDRMEVTEDENGERVSVTMSPAPNHGLDPDAEGTEEDA